jgi:hypothetical protein
LRDHFLTIVFFLAIAAADRLLRIASAGAVEKNDGHDKEHIMNVDDDDDCAAQLLKNAGTLLWMKYEKHGNVDWPKRWEFWGEK